MIAVAVGTALAVYVGWHVLCLAVHCVICLFSPSFWKEAVDMGCEMVKTGFTMASFIVFLLAIGIPIAKITKWLSK